MANSSDGDFLVLGGNLMAILMGDFMRGFVIWAPGLSGKNTQFYLSFLDPVATRMMGATHGVAGPGGKEE